MTAPGPAPRGPVTALLLGALVMSAPAALTAGCTYRVEHRKQGSFSAALGGKVPESETLPDGTVVMWENGRPASNAKPPSPDAKLLQLREENPDGTITLRAWQAQDVIANFLTCLRNEEYEQFWDQLVADVTKQEYELQGRADGRAEFVEFCRRNRRELAATANRLMLGFTRHETLLENRGNGVIRLRLYPQIAEGHQFTSADLIRQQDGMRLLVIR